MTPSTQRHAAKLGVLIVGATLLVAPAIASAKGGHVAEICIEAGSAVLCDTPGNLRALAAQSAAQPLPEEAPLPYPCFNGPGPAPDFCVSFGANADDGASGERPTVAAAPATATEPVPHPCTLSGIRFDWCERYENAGGAGERPAVDVPERSLPVLPCTTGGALEWCETLAWPTSEKLKADPCAIGIQFDRWCEPFESKSRTHFVGSDVGARGRKVTVEQRVNVQAPHPCATGAADAGWCKEHVGYDALGSKPAPAAERTSAISSFEYAPAWYAPTTFPSGDFEYAPGWFSATPL